MTRPRAAAALPGRTEQAKSLGVPHRAQEQQTRECVARELLEKGPVTASDVAQTLGVSPAGIRRHLDALVASDEATSISAPALVRRGRGRPARQYLLTATGRARFGRSEGLSELAASALRQLRELGGDSAVREFARRRVAAITSRVQPNQSAAATADSLAQALTDAGYAASTREVGNGVQLCQHHCPVAEVAAEFPELCEAERSVFADLLGTHVQRLATIANGDPVCTTHVPTGAQPAPNRTALRKEHA
ncbi:transcriptional regulator [Rhodococcus sp. X156]|uniref:helix-turn-helix transcriptional regulator n=1 Tax=Rhodococcus sp. X156 TaxID=2499145 RepID=UPI001F494A63|nr:transcriptional regulator [Rhodococcus sp. X156]